VSDEERVDRRRFLSRSANLLAGGAVLHRAALSYARTWDHSLTEATASTATLPTLKPSTNEVFPGIRRERAWIPMKDGVHLSAELWIPENAGPQNRVPPVWEYTPYRLEDDSIYAMYNKGLYISQHGIAAVLVDIRGTGGSQGKVPPTEYSEQEVQDGLEVIDWLSKQPWSNGNVGMWGISWTGINTLTIARLNPPALKAIIITGSAPDDEYYDDRYFEGFLEIDDWDFTVDHMMAISGAPDFPLDEETLQNRFDQPPYLTSWVLKHQRNGSFWKRMGLGRDYGAIKVPVFWFAGWYDGNQDTAPRVLANLKTPTKAIIGPWTHDDPNDSTPGPCIDWQHEALRWWRQWLLGEETGITREPRLSVFVQHWHPPGAFKGPAPGEWRYEDGWPIARSQATKFYLGPERNLSRQQPAAPTTQQLRYVPSAGCTVQMYWEGFLPDPAPDEGYALTYDTSPLEEDLEILGWPRVELRGSVDAPLGHWFARLEDIAPDGTLTTVTGCGLHGAQRESAENPSLLEPGRIYDFNWDMHFISWVFPKGHRIRVSIRNAWWPVAWPTPYNMTSRVYVGGSQGSRVILPIIPKRADEHSRPIPKYLPGQAPKYPVKSHRNEPPEDKFTRNLRYSPSMDSGNSHEAGTIEIASSSSNSSDYGWGTRTKSYNNLFSVNDDHPEAASAVSEIHEEWHVGDREIGWHTFFDFRSDLTHFHHKLRRELILNGEKIRERSWETSIPRDFH
jgi:putative CocE/NonD family hydrolase